MVRGSYDQIQFLRAWLANPLRVAAVAPSGASLAGLMTKEVMPSDGPVLELGPGTGAFTRALLSRGVDEADLTLVESGPDFARLLQRRYPRARVLCLDAARLGRDPLFAEPIVGAAVSGLPLLSMSPRKTMGILSGTFAYLRPGGALYQFTYGWHCPVPRAILDRLGLRAERIGRTFNNLPPASVYRITKPWPLGDERTDIGSVSPPASDPSREGGLIPGTGFGGMQGS